MLECYLLLYVYIILYISYYYHIYDKHIIESADGVGF